MSMTDDEKRARINELFDSIDENKNNAIDKDELVKFCKALDPDYLDEMIESDWAAMDFNADGKIEREELFNYYKDKME